MTDSNEELVAKLRGVDHMSVEDCFLQSPLFEKAATCIESLTRELAEAKSTKDHWKMRARGAEYELAKPLAERAEAASGVVARTLLRDVLDYIEDEFLRDEDRAHHNDRERIKDHNAAQPALLERIRSALSPVTGAVDDGRSLAHTLASTARSLLSRPPELRGPFKTNEEDLRRVAGLGPRTKQSLSAVDDAAEWRIWAAEGELAFEAQGRAIVSIADDHVSYAVRHGEGGWEPGSFDPMAEPEKACAEILAALPTPSPPKGGDRP